jgi:hypothetical protein|tara:strand:+ start:278 stop:517 length:240 start_codon:yes stop_codon:yes gene_type:complete
MSAWDSDYYDDEEEYEMEIDEDYISLTCPVCQEPTYFGDYSSSREMCVMCIASLKENDPLKPLIDLVEKTLHQDACGKA